MGAAKKMETRDTILVIDDDRMVRTLLARRLAKSGYEVELVESGTAGLGRLREGGGRYALVLLDLFMPDVSGFEVLEALGAGASPDVPIVVLSADNDSSIVGRCLELGAAGFVPKPVKASALASTIERVLEARVR